MNAVGETRTYKKQKRMLNKVVQRPLLVTRKAKAPSAVIRSRQENRFVTGGGGGGGGYLLQYGIMILLQVYVCLGTKWRMTITTRLMSVEQTL